MDNPNGFTTQEAYLVATGLALTLVIPILLFHPFNLYLFEQGMKLRISCCSLIYKKVKTSNPTTFFSYYKDSSDSFILKIHEARWTRWASN